MNLDRVIAVRNTKTVYRDGDKCIKVFRDGFSKADVLNEALNQARVEETGLNIPKIIEVTTIDGKWAIVSEYVKGKTLAQLMEMEPEKKDIYLERFVDLQIEVHNQNCTLLSHLKDKLRVRLSQAEISATSRYDLHTRIGEMPKHRKLCHGDFNPSNVVIAEDGTAYILDWSHATQGNAAADAAITYLQFRLNGDMDAANKYIDLFCRKTDTDRQYIRRWLPIIAATQSVKCKEHDRETLLSWIDTIDF